MPKGATKLESKLTKWRAWGKENWQVLLFWLAYAFAGWYLGALNYHRATVKRYLCRVYKKLKVKSSAQATYLAFKLGLIC